MPRILGRLGVVFAMAAGIVLADFAELISSAEAGNRRSFLKNKQHAPQPQYPRILARDWEAYPPTGHPTVSPANIAPMQRAIDYYAAIVAKGGWRRIPAVQFYPGIRGEVVRLLRRRLMLSGDLNHRAGMSKLYDQNVQAAVSRFQVRHGLTPSGHVDQSTLLALNVPASARLHQLRLNFSRMQKILDRNASKFVLVNIPAAQIEAIDQYEVVSRHSAVVGKVDRQSPELHSAIHEINFNPYWHVPKSIIRKDLVPKARKYARKGKNILEEYRMDVFDGSGRKLDHRNIDWESDDVYDYAYRQEPGSGNSMGFVKINFYNKHAVFLHDTPAKSLFGRNFRAYSSGCVRAQNVEQLVSWLLDGNEEWDPWRIEDIKRSGDRIDIPLTKRVPIYMVYMTAWVTRDGRIHFRRDLYKEDGAGLTASAY